MRQRQSTILFSLARRLGRSLAMDRVQELGNPNQFYFFNGSYLMMTKDLRPCCAVWSENGGVPARNLLSVGDNLGFRSPGFAISVEPGFNMSGTDSKTGGKDYLLLFLQAKAVAEKVS